MKYKPIRKSRLFMLHPETNPGKVAALDDLHVEYLNYLCVCMGAMVDGRRFSLAKSEFQAFFPKSNTLSSQIVKNVRAHAVAIVSGWFASKYTTTLRGYIRLLLKAGWIDEDTAKVLHTIGKHGIDVANGSNGIPQIALNLYWSFMLDQDLVGTPPRVSPRIGMRMSEMTCVFGPSEQATFSAWWIAFSHLDAGKARIQLPLVGNPFVSQASDVSKGVLARKDPRGRWRFEVVENKTWEIPRVTKEMPRIGVDVGLNVMAALSNGHLLGADLKPRFNELYAKVRDLRANRQRQGLKENSPRLDRLESKLTGLVKTMAGTCANTLVRAYPGHAFVIEDLDLRGCRGQKRFAYRALHHALIPKAPTTQVNPAYTSQPCPSCGYLSRANRDGTKFVCRSCGRKAHADVVGGKSLLGRSEDPQAQTHEDLVSLKELLRTRYRLRRNRDSASGVLHHAPVPSGRRLTASSRTRAAIALNKDRGHWS